jgi:YozE SAM-like fold
MAGGTNDTHSQGSPFRVGQLVVIGDPDPGHPRRAPQFECSLCHKVIGRKADVYLLADRRAACQRCVFRHDLDYTHHGTHAAQALRLGIWPELRRMSFGQWLTRFADEQSAIGSLARDMLADDGWPRRARSLGPYVAHLENVTATHGSIATLSAAWARYETERLATPPLVDQARRGQPPKTWLTPTVTHTGR